MFALTCINKYSIKIKIKGSVYHLRKEKRIWNAWLKTDKLSAKKNLFFIQALRVSIQSVNLFSSLVMQKTEVIPNIE